MAAETPAGQRTAYHLTLRKRTRGVLLLILPLLIMVILDDYQGWRLALACLSGVWLISWLWARALGGGLSIQREIRFGWTQVGDWLEERFTLTNRSFFPAIWVQIEDHSNLPGHPASLVTGLEGEGHNQWRIRSQCRQRGLFTLGPTTLRTADPFGLYQIEITDPRCTHLLVTPPVVPLPEIEVAAGGRAEMGRPRRTATERTVSAEGVRLYLPGDSLRWVHWPTSARREELHVRLFESTPSGDWWIILDFEAGVQAGMGARSTAEHGVILAASLADRGLRFGRSVGLAAQGASFVWLPPRQGEAQRWRILQSLALLTPGERSLSEVLAGLQPALHQTASLIIITPNLEPDWLSALLPLIWQGSTPTVLLLDAAAFGAGEPVAESSAAGVPPAAADRRAATLSAELRRWGSMCYVITPDLLDRPEAQPGRQGQLEWRVSPTGRAIMVNPPREATWRSLA